MGEAGGRWPEQEGRRGEGPRDGERPHVPAALGLGSRPRPTSPRPLLSPFWLLMSPASRPGSSPPQPGLCPVLLGLLPGLSFPAPFPAASHTLGGTACHRGHSSPKQASLEPATISKRRLTSCRLYCKRPSLLSYF